MTNKNKSRKGYYLKYLMSCFVAIMLWTTGARAQTVTIGNPGSSTSTYYIPINNFYSYTYSQQIILSSEIGMDGNITKIKFYWLGVGDLNNGQNWTVYLGYTTASSFANSTSWVPLGSLTQVFSGTVAQPSGAGYTCEVTLTTPFLYEQANGNLVIAVDENQSGYSSSTNVFKTTAGANRSIYYRSDGTNPNPASPPTGTLYGYYNNMQLEMVSNTPCAGTPAPGNTVASANPVCSGSNVNLTLQNSTSGSGVVYQWESADDAAFTVNQTNLGTANSQSITVTSTKYYRCLVTCVASGQSAYSNPLQITLNPFSNCYCSSSATSTADEEIFGVQVGSMNNISTCSTTAPGPGSVNSMYSNYKGFVTPATVSQGQSVPFSLTLGYCGSSAWSNVAAIYIDYNQDGNFTGTGELVYQKTYASGTYPSFVVSGNFTVPLTAALGTTAMRVVYAEASTVSPCGTYSWGETEDYLIDIVATNNCSGTPAASTTLSSATNVCPSVSFNLSLSTSYSEAGMTYQWQSSTDGGLTWTNFGTNDPFASVSLTATTMYQCIITCTFSGQSVTSTPVTVNANPFYDCYCASGATTTADEEIFGVTVGSMSNTSTCSTTAPGPGSGNSKYSNYKGFVTPATVAQGQTVPFSLNLGYCGSNAYANTAAIYIDFNQNGLFTDAGENVYTKPYASGTLPSFTVSGTFTIPLSATVGQTSMRIVYTESSTISPCGTFSWGETEDYLIDIIPLVNCSGAPAASNTLADVTTICSGTNFNLSLSTNYTDQGLIYQWQSSTDGGLTWVNFGTNTPYQTASQTVATQYQCVVTCSNSGLSITTSPVSVSMSPFNNCYCTTGLGGSCSINSMSSVAIPSTTLNNVTNGCTGTYNAFPASGSTTATLTPTVQYTLNVGIISGSSNTQVAIWIDYNQNGIYEASEFTLINSNIAAPGPGSGTFTIPVSALPGNTGMRVRSDWYSSASWTAADACTSRDYGETEDYIITIGLPPSCLPPTSPTIAVTSTTSADLSWTAPSPAPAVGYEYAVTTSATPPVSGTPIAGTNTSVSGLTPNTTYYLHVRSDCGSGSYSSWKTSGSAYTGYCQVNTTTNTYGISNFTTTGGFSNINNSSGLTNYSDFTALSVSQTAGGAISFSMTSGSGTCGAAIWVDWNNNMVFDASEKMYNAGAYVSVATGTFSVPSGQAAGNYRMRIVMNYLSTNPTACGDLGSANYGEAEDYTFTVTPPPTCIVPSALNAIPSLNAVSLSWSAPLSGNPPVQYQYAVTTSSIPPVSGTNISGTSTVVGSLTPNTTYYAHVRTDCGSGDYSAWATVSFMTGYCANTNSSSSTYYISDFSTTGAIANITNNTSGFSPNGYGNYTALTVSQVQGQSFNYSITSGYGTMGFGVWIDWNQDLDFNDAGEQIYVSGTYLSSAAGTITIPVTAALGTTRMRIVGNYLSTSPTACTGTSYTECEDYSINILAPTCLFSPIAPANGGSACPDNGMVHLSWPSLSGATGYDVYFDTNNPPTTLVSTNQADTTFDATIVSGTTFYWMVVPQISGGGTSCSVWSFNLSPSPIAVASSGGDVCQGADIYLTGDNVDPGQSTGNTYSWTGPNGFTSSDQNPVIYGPGSINSGTYTMVVTNQFGCSGTSTTTVNVNPNPTLTILSQQDVGCIGGSDGSVTIGASGGTANYDFTADFVNYFNDPSQATIDNLPEGTTVVYVSDANACLTTIPVTLGHISTVPPSQNVIMPFAGMPANACPGTIVTLSIPSVPNATKYIWDGPPGTYFNGNPSPYTSNVSSVQILFGTPSTSLYQIGVQAANGCGASIRKIQKVRYSVSVPSAISGDATVCANTSGKVYSIPAAPTGATEYQWTISGDASINGQGNTVTTTALNVTVDFGPGWTGGTLCVAAKTSCYTSAYKCFPISTASGNFGIISGSFSACANTLENYSVTPGPGVATYNWTVPANAMVSSGQGTNSIIVDYTPSYNNVGNICVTATSICGVTSAPKCKTVAPSLPSRPSSISGINNGLCGSTNVTYSTPAISGVTYSWTVPAGATIVSGNGTNSIKVNFGTFTNGQICVTTNNTCGFSLDRCITVKGAPNKPSGITANPSTWCAYDAGIEFTANVSNITGIYSLSWSYPNSTTYVQGGGNSTSLTLDWGGTNGVVMVTSSNACGNGTATYSSNLSCRESEMSASVLNVYPNPTAGMLNVEYTTEKGTAQVTVLDLSGRVVMTQTQPSVEGKNTMQLDLSRVAKGAYMLNVQTQSGNNQVRIVVE
ncbi:MAG: hypothetical protein FNNCIFGK_01162 [Bacteroidia bacterium]|nr:hypothetical protein [Bacteroidia bacterium]MCB8931390.1 T9SS type A sorting domain-containing protein [Bacteroidia bacterium]